MSNFGNFLTDISYKKQFIIDENNEGEYYPQAVNSVFSKFSDAIFQVQEMNIRPDIPKRAHYMYLFDTLRSRKRFKKGMKHTKPKYFDIIQNHYKYSDEKTEKALRLLTKKQINEICKLYDKGGKK